MAWYWWTLIGIVGLVVGAVVLFATWLVWMTYRNFGKPQSFDDIEPGMQTEVSVQIRARLDPKRLERIDPYLAANQERMKGLARAFGLCDGRPAFIVSLDPFVVASHSDDLDAVVLNAFDPATITDAARMKVGHRLLCAMGYQWIAIASKQRVAPDLLEGVGSNGRFANLQPIIVDFLSGDRAAIDEAKKKIPEADWNYAWEMAQEFYKADYAAPRDGRPSRCHIPSRGSTGWAIGQGFHAIKSIFTR